MSDFVIWRLIWLLTVIGLAITFVVTDTSWLKVFALVMISVSTVNMAWTRADLQKLSDDFKKHGKL